MPRSEHLRRNANFKMKTQHKDSVPESEGMYK